MKIKKLLSMLLCAVLLVGCSSASNSTEDEVVVDDTVTKLIFDRGDYTHSFTVDVSTKDGYYMYYYDNGVIELKRNEDGTYLGNMYESVITSDFLEQLEQSGYLLQVEEYPAYNWSYSESYMIIGEFDEILDNNEVQKVYCVLKYQYTSDDEEDIYDSFGIDVIEEAFNAVNIDTLEIYSRE